MDEKRSIFIDEDTLTIDCQGKSWQNKPVYKRIEDRGQSDDGLRKYSTEEML